MTPPRSALELLAAAEGGERLEGEELERLRELARGMTPDQAPIEALSDEPMPGAPDPETREN